MQLGAKRSKNDSVVQGASIWYEIFGAAHVMVTCVLWNPRPAYISAQWVVKSAFLPQQIGSNFSICHSVIVTVKLNKG